MNDYYEFLDREINDLLGVTIGFTNILRAKPYSLNGNDLEHYFQKYKHIKEFHSITQSLFHASLHHEFDPEVASLVLNELPDHLSWSYHRSLTPEHIKPPVFFRTDEVAPGVIAEIQCPGSAWGLYEGLYRLYRHHTAGFGEMTNFPRGLTESFAAALREYLGKDPIICHKLDDASIPYGMRYFIQRSRRYGLKYYGYDKDITAYDCNFVRAHSFEGLAAGIFAKRRLADCKAGLLQYDLPPSVLFDEKIHLIFPFWEKTRDHYSDEIRSLFPYTQLVTPDGFVLEDGHRVTLEQFCNLPQKQRNYYVKYAGCDLDLNWGSKGVYYCSSFSRGKCRELFDQIVQDYSRRAYWIIQKGHLADETTSYFTRSGELTEARVYTKISGFYGPSGLMGIYVMQRPFFKVHGTTETIVSLSV